ncbi:MAG TPA: PhoU domain-containing protein, partial [Aggregatilineales bacterium]|nr:PhoU domain-containing protein [Aggregatilineales bacterium]
MRTRSNFEHLLGSVKEDVLRLASMVDSAIGDSIKALQNRDEGLATRVSTNDANLNQLRYEIEERCYIAIALQQPNATDLRVIVGAVSVVTNLERIGDHAAGIARLTLRMLDEPPVTPLDDIVLMAESAREMVRDAVEAFIKPDVG